MPGTNRVLMCRTGRVLGFGGGSGRREHIHSGEAQHS